VPSPRYRSESNEDVKLDSNSSKDTAPVSSGSNQTSGSNTFRDEGNLVADSYSPTGCAYTQGGDPYYYPGGNSYDSGGYPTILSHQMQHDAKDDLFESRGRTKRRQSVSFAAAQGNTHVAGGDTREGRESPGSGSRDGDDLHPTRGKGRVSSNSEGI
jgi:hypothetical protein